MKNLLRAVTFTAFLGIASVAATSSAQATGAHIWHAKHCAMQHVHHVVTRLLLVHHWHKRGHWHKRVHCKSAHKMRHRRAKRRYHRR